MSASLDDEAERRWCLLELLAGGRGREKSRFMEYFSEVSARVPDLDRASCEELNKLLLAAGFNRVSDGFFRFFESLGGRKAPFETHLEEWRKLAMLRFANFRYPFRTLSDASHEVLSATFVTRYPNLAERGPFRGPPKPIAVENTPLLGSLAGRKVRALKRDRDAGKAFSARQEAYVRRYETARAQGLHNLYEYCTSENIDLYVATSMRETEEYYVIARFLHEVFGTLRRSDRLGRVVFFDPTQCSHDDPFAKGFVEGLMLKRAACTVYLAQERDSVGKDSELATTLVQGKPAVVYVPEIRNVKSTVEEMRVDLVRAGRDDPDEPDLEHPENKRLVQRFRSLFPEEWAEGKYTDEDDRFPSQEVFEKALYDFVVRLKEHYDDRAELFKTQHPLRVQVIAESGVPNGVLVVRSAKGCRAVLRDVLLKGLRFDIKACAPDSTATMLDLKADLAWDRQLVERRTKCAYRVAVGDSPLANAFWNWYVREGKMQSDEL